MDTRFFSSQGERLRRSLERFPAAYCLLLLLVSVLTVNTLSSKLLSGANFTFAWQFSAIGFLLALATDLLREQKVFRRAGWWVEGTVLALWLVMAGWYSRHQGVEATYAVSAVAIAAVVAGLTVPFLRDRDDVQMCRGTRDILWDGFTSGFVVGVLLLLLLLLVETGGDIFKNRNGQEKLFSMMYILFGLGLFGVLLLARIPDPWPSGKGFSRIAEGAAKWLFLPLLCAYLVTLYIYAIRILIQWKLPDGEVSVLVTVSMGLLLAVLFVLGPWARKEQPPALRTTLQTLPWLVIPLLVLMSVGIVRRISDYGFTVDRVYLVLFNLWCYGVCLYLGLNGGGKFRWIPLSFALILLLASIGPWNVSRMVRKGMLKEVRTLVGDAELPLTEARIFGLGEEKTKALLEKLDYLQDHYGSSSIEAFVTLPFSRYDYKVEYKKTDLDFHVPYSKTWTADVPEGFSRVADFSHDMMDVISVSGDTLRISLAVGDKAYWFDVPRFGLAEPVTLHAVNDNAVLQVRILRVDAKTLADVEENGLQARYRHGNLSGLLFY